MGTDEGLAEALVAVADGLDLPVTLDRILQVAMKLTGARYGALGVLGSGPDLAQFRHAGMPQAATAAIGHTPRGRGVLGELIAHPQPLRLAHLAEHPSATGFPPGHPPMDAFLGVPIRVGDAVFGNLYLTEKPGGFTAADEDRVVALAGAAGVAIHNAQLFETAQIDARWQAAATEMANAALHGEDGGTVLELLARHARTIAEAAVAIVVSPVHDELLVEVIDAETPVTPDEAQHLCDAIRAAAAGPGDDVIAACLAGDRAGQLLSDLPVQTATMSFERARVGCFPVRNATSSVGTLVLVWPDQEPTPQQLAAVNGMALQAAVSLTLDVARLSEHKLLVLRDRDRIARDLHDLVVQRLFASGVSLQVLDRRDDLPGEAHERIGQLINELDGTIEQIRETIFELREGFSGTWQLTQQLQAELDRMTEPLGFTPYLQVDADLTTLDADDIAADAVAVVREGLSNVARHAAARSATVRVSFDDGTFTIDVVDDGAGPGSPDRRSGLGNLADRAADRGGTSELTASTPTGSLLRWQVPLHV